MNNTQHSPPVTDLENDLVIISTSYQKYAFTSGRLKFCYHKGTKDTQHSFISGLAQVILELYANAVLHPLIKIRWKAKSFINYR